MAPNFLTKSRNRGLMKNNDLLFKKINAEIKSATSLNDLLHIFNVYVVGGNETDRAIGLGRISNVVTAKNDEVKTAFKVVEASELTPSNTLDGRINPAYPQYLQPRDRTRKSSLLQVSKMAKNINPVLLSDSGLSSHGAPIIGRDNSVESGNGRTMAIQKSYVDGTADKYKQYLIDNAALYGIDSDKIKAMQSPVLVRERLTDVDRAKFARDSNLSDLQSMSASETAFVDAESITDNMLKMFSPGSNGNLLADSNKPFVDAFLSEIGDNSSAGLLTSDGRPTIQLLNRLQNAIFAKAYKSSQLVKLVSEEPDPDVRNVLTALNSSAKDFVTMQYLDGEAHKQTSSALVNGVTNYADCDDKGRQSLGRDALKAIISAAELVKKAKISGQSIEELISQSDLFDSDDVAGDTLARFIANNSRSAKRLSIAFKSLAEAVNSELSHRASATRDLFGDSDDVTLLDILANVSKKLEQQFGSGFKQTNLFESMMQRTKYILHLHDVLCS